MTWKNTIDIDSCHIQESHRAIDIHYCFVSENLGLSSYMMRIYITGGNVTKITFKAMSS